MECYKCLRTTLVAFGYVTASIVTLGRNDDLFSLMPDSLKNRNRAILSVAFHDVMALDLIRNACNGLLRNLIDSVHTIRLNDKNDE